jgi:hypothetical protein
MTMLVHGVPIYTLTPGPPVIRESITRTHVTNYSRANQLTTELRRPLYRFTLNFWPLTHGQLNSLSALHALHQETVPFYWDGGEFGRVENYNLVDIGNGQRKIFYLPNRFVDASSFLLGRRFTNTTSLWGASGVGGYLLYTDLGALRFNDDQVPRSGHDIIAKYGCVYRLTFEDFRVRELAANVFAAEVKLIEHTLIG